MKIGIIGIGSMGKAIAENLSEKSYSLNIYNRTRSKLAWVKHSSIKICDNPVSVFWESDFILLCLSDDNTVKSVLQEQSWNEIKNRFIIDLSSISSNQAKENFEFCRKRDAYYFDAPVSGGVEGARKGDLTIMVGGLNEKFKIILPILKEIGNQVTFMGSAGSGSITKQINQIIVASYLAGISEAFAFADLLKMDLKKVYKAISKGYAQSRVMEAKFPNFINDTFPLGGKVSLHKKDLVNTLKTAKSSNVKLKLTEFYLNLFETAEKSGFEDFDHSVLFKVFKEKLRGI